MGQTLSTMAASPSGVGPAHNVLNRLFLASASSASSRIAKSSALAGSSAAIPSAASTVATTNIRRRLLPLSLFSSPSPSSYPLSMASSVHSAASSDISTPQSSSPSSSVVPGRSSHSSISNKPSSVSSRRLIGFNPISSVQTPAIEESLKMANLDQHRGYVQNHSGEVKQYRTTEYIPESQAAGYQVIREPFWNKGK